MMRATRESTGGSPAVKVLDGTWRRGGGVLASEHSSGASEALVVRHLPRPEQPSDTRVFTAHPEGSIAVAATAHGAPHGGRAAANSIAFIQLRTQKTHKRLSNVPVHFPATAVHWAPSDLLAFGTTEGRILLYPGVGPQDAASTSAFDCTTAHTIAVDRMKATRSVSVSPYKWCYSSCVVAVEVAPCGRKLLGVETNKVHQWDIEGSPEGQPVRTSSGTVLCAHYSPTMDNVVATGAATGGAKVSDLRSKKDFIWKAPVAHTGPVRGVRFSPLMAHLCLTATDSGDVKVWDIRMSGSAGAVLSANHNVGVVRGVSWSPLHAEYIALTGMMGRTTLLSLADDTPQVVASPSHDHPCVGLSFTAAPTDHMSTVTFASMSGEVTSIGLSPTFLESLGHFKDGDPVEACRRLVYLRDLRQAEQMVKTTVKTLTREGNAKAALQVASILRKHVPEELPRGGLLADAVAAFRTDVAACRRSIPPLMAYTPGSGFKSQQLNVLIGYLHAEGDWKGLVSLVGEHLCVAKLLDRWQHLDSEAPAAVPEVGGSSTNLGVGVQGSMKRKGSFIQQPSGCTVDLTGTAMEDGIEALFDDSEKERIELFLVAIQPELYLKLVDGLARYSWTLGTDFFLLTARRLGECSGMDDEAVIEAIVLLCGEMIGDERVEDDDAGHISRVPPETVASALLELRRLRLVTGMTYAPEAAARIVTIIEDGDSITKVLDVQCSAVVHLYICCLMHTDSVAKAVWVVDVLAALYQHSLTTASALKVADKLMTRYQQRLEKEKAKLKDTLQGRILIDTVQSVASFAVEMTGLARRLVYQQNLSLDAHEPDPAGPLGVMLKLCVKISEEMRGVVTRLARHVVSTAPAVRKECESQFVSAYSDLARTIDATQLGRADSQLSVLARQAAANSESMLASLQS